MTQVVRECREAETSSRVLGMGGRKDSIQSPVRAGPGERNGCVARGRQRAGLCQSSGRRRINARGDYTTTVLITARENVQRRFLLECIHFPESTREGAGDEQFATARRIMSSRRFHSRLARCSPGLLKSRERYCGGIAFVSECFSQPVCVPRKLKHRDVWPLITLRHHSLRESRRSLRG